MSANLKSNLPLLQIISDIKDKKLQLALLKYYSKNKKFQSALREISKNVIKGNVKLSNYKRRKLAKFKNNIYSIAYENKPAKIVQTCGWLWVIPIIASLLK